MSDPVTNVEIEDVLSSIRRLVSDGDKARTRDPAPQNEVEEDEQDAAFEAPVQPESQPVEATPATNLNDKLVLTPAFLVLDDTAQAEPEAETEAQDDVDLADVLVETSQEEHSDFEDAAEDEGPLELTNMVWDAPEEADVGEDPQVETIQTPDRSELVATIAELEAAISTDNDEYEPDGSEMPDEEPMAQTIAWPGTFARSTEGVEDAVTTPLEQSADDETSAPDTITDYSSVTPFQRSTTDAAPEFDDNANADVEEFDDSEPDSKVDAAEVEADVYADDDIDDLIEAGGVTLDDEALRAMIADVVREELTGPLGERITRNVRKLVRREIYRVLSSQDFD